MNPIPQHLVEVGEYFGEGYKPVLDFHGWRVAVLRHREGVSAATMTRVERHNETNEVFILTDGAADLIIMDGDDTPTEAHVFAMQPNVMYNIQQGVWHHTILSEDAHIVLVERTNTGLANSDYFDLSEETLASIKAQLTLA